MAKFEKTISRMNALMERQAILLEAMKDGGAPDSAIKDQEKAVKAIGVSVKVLTRRRNILLSKEGGPEADLI